MYSQIDGMFDKNDKMRLYWLMDNYLTGKIDEKIFCDEFYYSYDLEIDYETLTDAERKAFSELSTVASRFSEFDEDHRLDARAFSTKEELRQKILKTQESLPLPYG